MKALNALILGVATAVVLAVSWPVWVLMQWGGPIPFTVLWFPVVTAFLLRAVFKIDVRNVASATFSGLAFGVPVAIFCWYLPHHEDFARTQHGVEMRWLTMASLIVPVACFLCAAFTRNKRKQDCPTG